MVYSNTILNHGMLNVKSFETEYSYDDLNVIVKDMREKNQINIKKKSKTNMISLSHQDTFLNEDFIENKHDNVDKKSNNKSFDKNVMNLTDIPSRKCKLINGNCDNKIKPQEIKPQENKSVKTKKLFNYSGQFKLFNK